VRREQLDGWHDKPRSVARVKKKTADPSTSVGMTKGEVRSLVGIRCRLRKLRIPPLPPDFLSRFGGVGELHAAFFTESRIRGHWWRRVVGNPGFGRDDKGEGGASVGNLMLVERTPSRRAD
jgi:hypothetical protein